MGKKSSSSAPAVDPSVGIAMEKQAALAEQQQAWYENEMYPWLKAQTEKQNQYSEMDRANALENYKFWQNMAQEQVNKQNALADEFYDRWKTQYKPIEDSLIADAARYNTSAEAERQAGLAIGDSATAYAAQKQALAQQMQAYGINPTAGAYQAQTRAMGVNQAAVQAAAANQARTAAQELGWNKRQQIAALGQQYIGNSLNATNSANNTAGTMGGLAGNALGQGNAFGQQGTQNITNLANVGLQSYQALGNAWGNYGNMGMQLSNYNQNAWNATQQANAQKSAGAMGAIGTIAGSALGFMAMT